MTIFDATDFDDHEQVIFCFDKASGLKAIIAIHNTRLGPALGGTRFWSYASETDALKDVLRLSRGMTYKAALANLPLGGGKGVIIGDAKTQKTPEKMLAYGRFVERLGGLFITGEDVGTNVQDMSIIYKATKHVRGREVKDGGVGDPSPITAYGVYKGIRAAVLYKTGRRDLDGVKVAIQGLGHVGIEVARRLAEDGAILTVSDLDDNVTKDASRRYHARIVKPEEIYAADVDVFVPCAMGGILNDNTIPQLKCQIVAGSANNQLAEPRHAQALYDRGILYAPDYLVNAGGLIDVAFEGPGYDVNEVLQHVASIYDTLIEIFENAKAQNITTSEASDRIARRKLG